MIPHALTSRTRPRKNTDQTPCPDYKHRQLLIAAEPESPITRKSDIPTPGRRWPTTLPLPKQLYYSPSPSPQTQTKKWSSLSQSCHGGRTNKPYQTVAASISTMDLLTLSIDLWTALNSIPRGVNTQVGVNKPAQTPFPRYIHVLMIRAESLISYA